MKKRNLFSILFVCILMITGLLPVHGAELADQWAITRFQKSFAMKVDSTLAYARDVQRTIDESNPNVKPFIKKGTVYVPFRFTGELMGGRSYYDEEKKTETITFTPGSLSAVELSLQKGSDVLLVNKTSKIPLSAPAEVRNQRLYIPADTFGQSVGKNVFIYDGLILFSDYLKIFDTVGNSALQSLIYSRFHTPGKETYEKRYQDFLLQNTLKEASDASFITFCDMDFNGVPELIYYNGGSADKDGFFTYEIYGIDGTSSSVSQWDTVKAKNLSGLKYGLELYENPAENKKQWVVDRSLYATQEYITVIENRKQIIRFVVNFANRAFFDPQNSFYLNGYAEANKVSAQVFQKEYKKYFDGFEKRHYTLTTYPWKQSWAKSEKQQKLKDIFAKPAFEIDYTVEKPEVKLEQIDLIGKKPAKPGN